jgi:hypothetical protein
VRHPGILAPQWTRVDDAICSNGPASCRYHRLTELARTFIHVN